LCLFFKPHIPTNIANYHPKFDIPTSCHHRPFHARTWLVFRFHFMILLPLGFPRSLHACFSVGDAFIIVVCSNFLTIILKQAIANFGRIWHTLNQIWTFTTSSIIHWMSLDVTCGLCAIEMNPLHWPQWHIVEHHLLLCTWVTTSYYNFHGFSLFGNMHSHLHMAFLWKIMRPSC
jgi:hypothetical protein